MLDTSAHLLHYLAFFSASLRPMPKGHRAARRLNPPHVQTPRLWTSSVQREIELHFWLTSRSLRFEPKQSKSSNLISIQPIQQANCARLSASRMRPLQTSELTARTRDTPPLFRQVQVSSRQPLGLQTRARKERKTICSEIVQIGCNLRLLSLIWPPLHTASTHNSLLTTAPLHPRPSDEEHSSSG